MCLYSIHRTLTCLISLLPHFKCKRCVCSDRSNSSNVLFVLAASVAAAHNMLLLVNVAFGFSVTFLTHFDFLSEILNFSILLPWMEPIMWTYFQLSRHTYTQTSTNMCIFLAYKFKSIYCIFCDEAVCTHTPTNLTIKCYVVCLGGLRYSSVRRHVQEVEKQWQRQSEQSSGVTNTAFWSVWVWKGEAWRICFVLIKVCTVHGTYRLLHRHHAMWQTGRRMCHALPFMTAFRRDLHKLNPTR